MIKLYEEYYSCSACGVEGRGDGVSHIARIHLTNNSPYRCHCGQNFIWSNELYRHLVESHLIVMYECQICGLYLNDLLMIQDHIRQHQ